MHAESRTGGSACRFSKIAERKQQMILIKNLAKYYGNLAAVDDLSLTIQEGDIFGFIGPNGAGKTTTMRILVTLLEPTSGKAFIDLSLIHI